ncbi:uncharacterized protein CLUP02_06838 [Colletotrichum lupini]|uniref:Secreted protein n=1 Tax=Colletotrichum lupini TaxID=145971 RepID=A0A9Q8WFX7_9PEZI|nr:uncharacterized protein CLUP02_06838 [Colletotrichum lupini]KAK1708763.1 hypothetical protein BDP67DRAFT_524584 [Colletotrichum lupini]UQC81352.1 hypothetical protein CLUP02_06838 [Colletotrichum lupini]
MWCWLQVFGILPPLQTLAGINPELHLNQQRQCSGLSLPASTASIPPTPLCGLCVGKGKINHRMKGDRSGVELTRQDTILGAVAPKPPLARTRQGQDLSVL